MPKQCHEIELGEPMTAVFNALITALAARRWGEALEEENRVALPRVGCRYANRRAKVLRLGRVLECLRPVALTLHETLIDPPCRVRLELRWRLEPTAGGCLLRLRVRYALNAAARLRRRHWHERIRAHCARMLEHTRAAACPAQGAGRSGQSTGNSSIAVTKTMAVSGRPILR